MRLQKVLARAGIASRRRAEALIQAGRVRVNGQTVTQLGGRVDPTASVVTVDGEPIPIGERAVYLALHKPPGYLATVRDPHGRPTIMSLVPSLPGLFPAGRLDAASEGLILLSTDGEWAQRVTHPRFGCTKEYLVDVPGRVDETTLTRLRRPMRLAPCESTTGAAVEVDSTTATTTTRLRIVLHEGRNRQIRRMLEAVGYPVLRLQRLRVGPIHLGKLPPGRWRRLTPEEVEAVRRHAA